MILKGKQVPSKPQKKKKGSNTIEELKKVVLKAKRKMEHVASSLEQVKDELNSPDLYTHHTDSVSDLMRKRHQLEKDLVLAEEAWLRAEEDLNKAIS